MKKIKGFTLLELLVVIGIIAILVSIGTVSYTSAQRSARDSRRKADLDAMRQALEQYYQAQASPGYPAGVCSVGAGVYIKGTWPADPGTGGNYPGWDGCTSASYCICADMEKDAGGNASAANCTSWAANGAYYCVANQQ